MPHQRPSITSPADAANLVMSEMSLLEAEEYCQLAAIRLY
jgi:hypothetical protein